MNVVWNGLCYTRLMCDLVPDARNIPCAEVKTVGTNNAFKTHEAIIQTVLSILAVIGSKCENNVFRQIMMGTFIYA